MMVFYTEETRQHSLWQIVFLWIHVVIIIQNHCVIAWLVLVWQGLCVTYVCFFMVLSWSFIAWVHSLNFNLIGWREYSY